MGVIAVVRIRGVRKINPEIKKTLEYLNLSKPNYCTVVKDSPQNLGMVRKAKDYVAYGKINDEMLFTLLKKRGRKGSKKLKDIMSDEEIKNIVSSVMDGKKLREFADPVFRLRPPSKGFKSTKEHYPRGDLGEHDDISKLLKRMC